jgi:hypothetical protein
MYKHERKLYLLNPKGIARAGYLPDWLMYEPDAGDACRRCGLVVSGSGAATTLVILKNGGSQVRSQWRPSFSMSAGQGQWAGGGAGSRRGGGRGGGREAAVEEEAASQEIAASLDLRAGRRCRSGILLFCRAFSRILFSWADYPCKAFSSALRLVKCYAHLLTLPAVRFDRGSRSCGAETSVYV